MSENESKNRKYYDIVFILIFLLILTTIIDLNISLEQILKALFG